MNKLQFDLIGGDAYEVITPNSVKIGELFKLEDGYYVFEFDKFRGGVLTQYDLKQIHDKLELLNTPQDNSVNLYFALKKVGLSDWLTKDIGKLVLAELENTNFNIEWFVGHLLDLKNSSHIELYNHFDIKGERVAGVVIDGNTRLPLSFHCDKKTLREALIEVGFEE